MLTSFDLVKITLSSGKVITKPVIYSKGFFVTSYQGSLQGSSSQSSLITIKLNNKGEMVECIPTVSQLVYPIVSIEVIKQPLPETKLTKWLRKQGLYNKVLTYALKANPHNSLEELTTYLHSRQELYLAGFFDFGKTKEGPQVWTEIDNDLYHYLQH